VHYSFDVRECHDVWYALSCIGSSYLIGCICIQNGAYKILNQDCSETDYHSTVEKLKTDKKFRISFEEKFSELIKKIGIEKHILTGSVDSTGDFCYDSNGAYECYDSGNLENCMYVSDSTS
jgi:hypothetical protein